MEQHPLKSAETGKEAVPSVKGTWVPPILRKQSVYATTSMMMAGATDGTSLS